MLMRKLSPELHPAAGAVAIVAFAATLASVVSVDAQDWPSRPVTMVVPFAAGGPADVVARILAQRLTETLGKPVVVENIGGAGGVLGSERVAKAAPDGYQFVLGNSGTHAYSQTLYKSPRYNAATDFAPVGLSNFSNKVLLVRKSLPANTLSEFIAYTKANQGQMRYGSGGAGSQGHTACLLLNAKIGVTVTHIPYRGASPAMQDLIVGRIDFMCDTVSTALPQIQANTVRPIALLSRNRTSVLPNLATAHEQGLANFEVDSWNAVFLPKGAPGPIVSRLNKALSETLDTPRVRERLESLGLTVVPPERQGPEYLAKFVRAEIEKWAAPIRASGVLID